MKRATGITYLIGGLVAVIGLVVAYIVYLLLSSPPPTPEVFLTSNEQYTGITAMDPPQPMPDFTLTDQHEGPLHLHTLQGQPTLIVFGFTHCPDVCPLTLQELRKIRDNLGD